MKEFAGTDSPDLLKSLFDHIGIGLMILDDNFRIIDVNTIASTDILTRTDTTKCDLSHCYSLLGKQDKVCADCPFNEIDNSPEKAAKSYVFKDIHGKNIYIKVWHFNWRKYHLLTIHNVTKEVTLVKKIDLNRKEAEAKNILLERRMQKLLVAHDELNGIINCLPEALVTVNNNFKIIKSNQAVSDVLNIHPIGQCYELFGNDSPCPDCPVIAGFPAGQSKSKHFIDNKYFTEIIIKLPSGEGGLLLFNDTTRQIELIEQIRNQQDTLSGLVELSDIMQQEDDIKTVLQIFLDKFLSTISSNAAILLVDDIRSGNLWQTMSKNVDGDFVANVSREYLSREVQNSSAAVVSDDSFLWDSVTQVSLTGSSGKRVGLLCFSGRLLDDQQEKVSLFTKSLGDYIDNKLLVRQLEEKANTDQMTGLYNRGYMDKALSEEQVKLDKYKINYAIVAVDINSLKKANDIYGHEAGDLLIKTVAHNLRNSLRGVDIVARIGGDEFLILLTGTGEKGAETYVSRLVTNFFTEVTIKVGDNEKFPVSISVGTAGTDCCPPEELKARADQNMYINKELFYKTEARYR